MQAVVRRHQRQFSLPVQVARRWFADRGSTRKDFSDPDFQTQGYINPSCFASTQPVRLSLVPKDFTHSPVYAGVRQEEQGYRVSPRKMGEARRAFEERKTQEKEVRKQMKENTVVPTQDYLAFPKRKAAKRLYFKKRARSRVIKDYSSFSYEGSGLDEYTEWLKEKKERRRKRLLARCKEADEPFCSATGEEETK